MIEAGGVHPCDRVSIFVDESGNLSFSESSLAKSPIFVIAYVVPSNAIRLANDLKKFVRQRLQHNIPELKFYEDSEDTKRKVLVFLNNECLFHAGYVAIDKRAVMQPKFREEPHMLYNYLAVHYVLDSVLRASECRGILTVTYVIDRSMNLSRRIKFDEYARRKAEWLVRSVASLVKMDVRHEDSRNEPCLQIADYLAGSVSRAFRGDTSYYSLISGKFREDWKVTWGLPKL